MTTVNDVLGFIETLAPLEYVTIVLNNKGDLVADVQQRLKDLGYLSGTADGDFGAATEAAVKAFQAQNGLTSDGIAGAYTQQALYSPDAVAAPSR